MPLRGMRHASNLPHFLRRAPPVQPSFLTTRFPQTRHQSQFPLPGGPRRKPQYNRFSRAQSIKYLWQSNPLFRYGIGATGVGTATFVVFNIETVPISGRWRFNWVSAAYEEEMGKQQYQEIMNQYRRSILPSQHPQTRLVRQVLERLIPNSGLDGQEWEVNIINDKDNMNAFVIPGGKVFVFSGLLPICNGEGGLATVLGHEIAHNVVHHAAENYSRMSWILPVTWLVSLVFDVSGGLAYRVLDFAYNKPGSRRQESEADFIGLMMMASSCYDPSAAISFWERMEKSEKVAIPQFISTHPSHHTRIDKMREWLPQAQEKQAESGCGRTMQYAADFQRAFGSERDEYFW